MTPSTRKATPTGAVAIAVHRRWQGFHLEKSINCTHSARHSGELQPWRPSRVQRRRSSQATATKLPHIPAHGHAAEAADPPMHSHSDPNPAASLTPARDPRG